MDLASGLQLLRHLQGLAIKLVVSVMSEKISFLQIAKTKRYFKWKSRFLKS